MDNRWERVTGSGLRRVYRLLCLVAHCDHELHPAERALLDRYRARFGIPEAEAAFLEDEGREGLNVRLGRDPVEQGLMLEAMIEVAAADGRLEPREQKRLLKVAGAIGLPQADLLGRLRARFAGDRVAPVDLAAGRVPAAAAAACGATPPRRHGVPKTSPGLPLHVVRGEPPRVEAAGPAPGSRPRVERDAYAHEPLGLESMRGPPPRARREAPTDLNVRAADPDDLDLPPTELGRRVPPTIPELRAPPSDPPLTIPRTVPGLPTPSLDFEDEPGAPRSHLSTVDEDRLQRAAMLTPRPDGDLEVAPPQPRATQESSTLSLSPGVIVLLGLVASEVRIDLSRVPVRPEFRGFDSVPPGLHHLTVVLHDGVAATLWVALAGGRVAVKMFDQKQRRFVDPAPQTASRYGTREQARALGSALLPYPYDTAVDWVELTVHLDPDAFPPSLRAADPQGWPTALAAAWKGSHKGDGQGLLTELAWAFLAGVLERHPAAFERWLTLFKAVLDADAASLREDPALFVLLADLLVAQLHQMPDGFFDRSVTSGADELAETYASTRVPHLVEAGDRLRRAVAARRGR